jgi:hypothetical protein
LTVLDFALSCKVKVEHLGLEIFFLLLKVNSISIFCKKKKNISTNIGLLGEKKKWKKPLTERHKFGLNVLSKGNAFHPTFFHNFLRA